MWFLNLLGKIIRAYLYTILYQPFVFDPEISCFLHDVDENHTWQGRFNFSKEGRKR